MTENSCGYKNRDGHKICIYHDKEWTLLDLANHFVKVKGVKNPIREALIYLKK